MIWFLTISFLLISSSWIMYQDVKDQMIPVVGLMLFILSSLSQFYLDPSSNLLTAGIVGLIFFSCFGMFYIVQKKPVMGWGDLILAPFCGLWMHSQDIPLFLITTGFIALFMGIFWKTYWGMRTFPLAPPLLLGVTFVIIIRCFFTTNGL